MHVARAEQKSAREHVGHSCFKHRRRVCKNGCFFGPVMKTNSLLTFKETPINPLG